MRLDDADDDVHAFGLAGAPGEQHFVGLADAGGRAQENAQLAAFLAFGGFEKGVRGRAPVGFIGHALDSSLRALSRPP